MFRFSCDWKSSFQFFRFSLLFFFRSICFAFACCKHTQRQSTSTTALALAGDCYLVGFAYDFDQKRVDVQTCDRSKCTRFIFGIFVLFFSWISVRFPTISHEIGIHTCDRVKTTFLPTNGKLKWRNDPENEQEIEQNKKELFLIKNSIVKFSPKKIFSCAPRSRIKSQKKIIKTTTNRFESLHRTYKLCVYTPIGYTGSLIRNIINRTRKSASTKIRQINQ